MKAFVSECLSVSSVENNLLSPAFRYTAGIYIPALERDTVRVTCLAQEHT